ncbi:MAG: hypothetical protein EXR98_12660 [Gemmataceae bacterium]|nr:hypothetical protein [Gemmataceae bacterium]
MLVKDGPTMTMSPFLTLCLGGKKDAVLARQRARRVASLLNFDAHEQICIAAGTFVIASQALVLFGKAKICFQIKNQHLHIFAQEPDSQVSPEEGSVVRLHGGTVEPTARRLAGLFPMVDPKSLFRMTKPLPVRELAAEEVELGWLVKQVEKTACNSVFDEIIKQNQEILALLHELRIFQLKNPQKEEKLPNPHAA